MAIHEYTCPTCKCIQRVKAEAGQVVEVEDCEACTQDKARREAEAESELDQALDELVPQQGKKRR